MGFMLSFKQSNVVGYVAGYLWPLALLCSNLMILPVNRIHNDGADDLPTWTKSRVSVSPWLTRILFHVSCELLQVVDYVQSMRHSSWLKQTFW